MANARIKKTSGSRHLTFSYVSVSNHSFLYSCDCVASVKQALALEVDRFRQWALRRFFVICFCSLFILFVGLDRVQITKGIEQLNSKNDWVDT